MVLAMAAATSMNAGCAAGAHGGGSAAPRATSFRELASFDCPYVESVVDSTRGAAALSIPDSIRALDGKRVVLDGYVEGVMFSLDGRSTNAALEAGERGARMFAPQGVLLTSQPFQCCMHEPPRASEAIVVELPEGTEIAGAPHQVMRVSGTLRIAPEIDAAHVLHGIYRLEASAIEEVSSPHPHGAPAPGDASTPPSPSR